MEDCFEIRSAIEAIENDTRVYEETNFDGRANAIDFIDFHIIDRIYGLQQSEIPPAELVILKQHAERVKSVLEKIDADVFKQLRRNIREGVYAKSSFKEMVCGYLGYDISNADGQDKAGYDNLDIFINGILSYGAVPQPATAPGHEMVFYQKTPARVIFQMAQLARLNPGDLFFDIGSGLGQASILMNLISGTPARGVEYEPDYCNYAKACALQLNLSNVEFINADAREAGYSGGTVFFMYTPFEGSMLHDMLRILQKESLKKAVTIFTYGPCSRQVAQQNWLECVNGHGDDLYKLYEFKSSRLTVL